jgi:hypothetical protein
VVAALDVKSQPRISTAFAIVEFVLFTLSGIFVAFAVEKVWLNPVLRGGVVLYCFTNACFPISNPFYGPVPRLLGFSRGWSFQLRWTGIAAASALICVGAVITRSAVGYLIGSCAFFYAWLLWWMLRKISPELHKDQSVATDT